MPDTDNIVIEMLRALRADISSVKEDVREIKGRVSLIESGIAGIRRDIADLSLSLVGQQVSHDRLVERVERIERRLDLTDAG